MEKEFIPYEQALSLKELGFDRNCFAWYDNERSALSVGESWKSGQKSISVPTFSQAFRWFREKYGYFELFDYQHGDSKINKGFFFNIININNEDFFFPEDFEPKIYKTYEETELECLKKLIEIVKNDNRTN